MFDRVRDPDGKIIAQIELKKTYGRVSGLLENSKPAPTLSKCKKAEPETKAERVLDSFVEWIERRM